MLLQVCQGVSVKTDGFVQGATVTTATRLQTALFQNATPLIPEATPR